MTKEEFLIRIKEDENYSPGCQAIDDAFELIELMKADGNADLVTDMRRKV